MSCLRSKMGTGGFVGLPYVVHDYHTAEYNIRPFAGLQSQAMPYRQVTCSFRLNGLTILLTLFGLC